MTWLWKALRSPLMALGALAGIIGALGLWGRQKRSEGRKDAKAEQQEKVLDQVKEAETVRRERRADPDNRDGVRRFDRTDR